eukprot:gene14303-20283_t
MREFVSQAKGLPQHHRQGQKPPQDSALVNHRYQRSDFRSHQATLMIVGMEPGLSRTTVMFQLRPGLSCTPVLSQQKPGLSYATVLSQQKPGLSCTIVLFQQKPGLSWTTVLS